jgi:hypothetical protein
MFSFCNGPHEFYGCFCLPKAHCCWGQEACAPQHHAWGLSAGLAASMGRSICAAAQAAAVWTAE